jgi:aconitate hydratase
MAFDLDMIRAVYAGLGSRIEAARTAVGRPLTLTEKILYAHLYGGKTGASYQRGVSYVDFTPDRRPARTRLLFPQPFTATTLSKPKTAPPKTSPSPTTRTARCTTSWLRFLISTASASGSPVLVSFTK